MTGDVLMSMWTVYDHPTDYPNVFVARRFEIIVGEIDAKPTDEVVIATNIESMNDHFERLGMAFLARHEADEPQIMGVWM